MKLVNDFKNFVWRIITFAFLLSVYFLVRLFGFIIYLFIFSTKGRLRLRSGVTKIFEKASDLVEKNDNNSIKRSQLIDLSVRNMKVRKARTIITIGGMMIGIGAVVFLVSIGYGLQDLVILRVAKLEEMKQATVTMQNGSKNILNDETLSKFKNMNDVESALPVISAVGKINFNNSVADVAVYGVTSDYLKKIDIKTTSGNIFDNNELTKIISAQNQEKTRIGEVLDDVKKESLIGDTVEANGLKYNEKGELVLANDADIIAEIKKVDLDGSEDRSAVVNQAMLQILGIQEVAAIGQKFTASFVMMGGSMGNHDEKIETTPSEYAIVGVIPEGKAAMLYMPFINLRSFGASNYAQIKVAVSNPKVLTKTRTQIEAMGYQTQSVADTVDQINNLFSTARMFLALVGMIALSVAALGMFNTLTVSLLERTREVGLMKAMGMKADEVRELFLTESMIMGFLGGALGIILGYVGGKVVGFALSFFSIMKGAGTISIASIPPILIFIIIALSLFVGIVTGIYPAKRAEKISALNALRYE